MTHTSAYPPLFPAQSAFIADTLITCHINADFDAFAAIIAAQYLFPGAILLFPGTQEKALHTFYTDTAVFMYAFKKAEQIDWDTVRRLVIVDTCQASRVPHVRPLLARTDIEIYIFDHHPPSIEDITTPYITRATVGACTTLLAQILRTKNAPLSCQDATILGLGIYADTGSFTYTSTTSEDYMAAAWLREKGMDVHAIADIAAHELSSAQVKTLHALLESATVYNTLGIPVVMAEVSMEHYQGDFALLAHKLMEMEGFTVLFALGRMGDRITVVARSRSSTIDVGHICTALGGGGHAYAASASVRDKTLVQVRHNIYQLLHSQAHPTKCARDYMSAPPIGIEACKNMQDAHELMTHFDLKAVPVFYTGSRLCMGILDAHTASRAVNHHLHDLDTYMQHDIRTLPPSAALSELMDIIVGARQSLVPIVEKEEVIGVVTRTDLINIFVEDEGTIAVPLRENRKERVLSKIMRDRLSKENMALLHKAGKLADSLGLAVYAVGGFVRDVLLDMPNQDVDIVVEGNGIAYARALAKELKGRVREHQKFLTAVVIYTETDGTTRHIDVASARLEYYKYPAALPTVEISSLKMDLFRRDFTVNALAIRLGKHVFGQLVDFFGGQRDIQEKRIRILHSLSFVEDPTRCLRAVRFEQRYGMKLDAGLEKLFKNTVQLGLVDKIVGARLFHEYKCICTELNPVACFERLNTMGVLAAIHTQISLNAVKKELLQKIKDVIDWYKLLYFKEQPQTWCIYLLVLCHKLGQDDVQDIISRMGVPKAQHPVFLQLRLDIRTALTRMQTWYKKKGSVSALCHIIEDISLEGVLFMLARLQEEELRRVVSRYITTWQHETIDISGKDLLAMGLEPGPTFGRIMRAVKDAKLDNVATTRESQGILAKTLAMQTFFK